MARENQKGIKDFKLTRSLKTLAIRILKVMFIN
jgi:hypothetical protein